MTIHSRITGAISKKAEQGPSAGNHENLQRRMITLVMMLLPSFSKCSLVWHNPIDLFSCTGTGMPGPLLRRSLFAPRAASGGTRMHARELHIALVCIRHYPKIEKIERSLQQINEGVVQCEKQACLGGIVQRTFCASYQKPIHPFGCPDVERCTLDQVKYTLLLA